MDQQTMTPAAFREWRAARGWTFEETARQLELSLRQVKAYASGEKAIPRVVALACEALARQ